MKICVIGTGYVGLVAGTCFAETGNDVTCMDIDEKKIDSLRKGKIPIYEPGLESMLKRNVAEERLKFSTDLCQSVRDSLIIFIAVGTPPGPNGAPDLGYVLAAARGIGQAMNGYKIIVNKSTVPVGTAAKVRAELSQHTRFRFDVVSNPEFLKEGAAIDDFMKPDRVVIGVEDVRVAEIMKELYAPFTRTGAPVLVMDPKSAEMTKYAANAMLASRISFMNEVANLCEHVGADVHWVRQGVGFDRRIGPSFLFAGLGYGGSCFPKDVKALIALAEEHHYPLRLVRAIEEVNEIQKSVIIDKVLKFYSSPLPTQLEELKTASSVRPAIPVPTPAATTALAEVVYQPQPSDYSYFLSLDASKLPDMSFTKRDQEFDQAVLSRIKNGGDVDSPIKGKTFAIWGLSFKPQTDDMREAPSQIIIDQLLGMGASVQAYDPEALDEAKKVFGKRIRYSKTNYEALKGADALILVTEWNVFRNPDFQKMKELLKYPVIFDGRNQYNPLEMRELGFLYFAIGRP
jgi:UDPglucose 6-dehydrogenase